jgi:hypothetical protein
MMVITNASTIQLTWCGDYNHFSNILIIYAYKKKNHIFMSLIALNFN